MFPPIPGCVGLSVPCYCTRCSSQSRLCGGFQNNNVLSPCVGAAFWTAAGAAGSRGVNRTPAFYDGHSAQTAAHMPSKKHIHGSFWDEIWDQVPSPTVGSDVQKQRRASFIHAECSLSNSKLEMSSHLTRHICNEHTHTSPLTRRCRGGGHSSEPCSRGLENPPPLWLFNVRDLNPNPVCC